MPLGDGFGREEIALAHDRLSLPVGADTVSAGHAVAAGGSRSAIRSHSAPASSAFVHRRSATSSPSAARIAASFVSVPKPVPARPTRLATSRSRPLRASLSLPGRLDVVRLRREAHQDLARTPVFPELGEDVGRRLELQLGDAVVLLELAVGAQLRTEVGDGGGHHDHVGVGRVREDRGAHLLGGLDLDDVHARRRAHRAGSEHERHPGAASRAPRRRPPRPSCRSSGSRRSARGRSARGSVRPSRGRADPTGCPRRRLVHGTCCDARDDLGDRTGLAHATHAFVAVGERARRPDRRIGRRARRASARSPASPAPPTCRRASPARPRRGPSNSSSVADSRSSARPCASLAIRFAGRRGDHGERRASCARRTCTTSPGDSHSEVYAGLTGEPGERVGADEPRRRTPSAPP